MLTFSTQRYDFALNCTKTPNCVEVYDPGFADSGRGHQLR